MRVDTCFSKRMLCNEALANNPVLAFPHRSAGRRHAAGKHMTLGVALWSNRADIVPISLWLQFPVPRQQKSLCVSVSLCLVGLSPSSRFRRGQLLTKVCFLVLWGGTGQEGVQWEEGQWRRRRGVVGGGDGGVVVLELSAISGQLIDFRHSVTDVPPL